MTWFNFKKEEQLVETIKAKPEEKQPPKEQPKDTGGKRYLDKNGKLLITAKVLELTKHFEGLELVARDDGYGTPTIGYGRIKYEDGRKVRNGDRCTESQAEAWLLHDLYEEGAKYVRAFLKDDVEEELDDDAFSVWVDLTFNRGAGRFREFIAPHLNLRDNHQAKTALVMGLNLNTAGGKYSLGLDRRRWAERLILDGEDWKRFASIDAFKKFKAGGYRG
jgi:lysozyme